MGSGKEQQVTSVWFGVRSEVGVLASVLCCFVTVSTSLSSLDPFPCLWRAAMKGMDSEAKWPGSESSWLLPSSQIFGKFSFLQNGSNPKPTSWDSSEGYVS